MKQIFDVLYKRGENADGKGFWSTIGVLMVKDNGKMSLKLDTIPCSNTWDGWLTISERDRTENSNKFRNSNSDASQSSYGSVDNGQTGPASYGQDSSHDRADVPF